MSYVNIRSDMFWTHFERTLILEKNGLEIFDKNLKCKSQRKYTLNFMQ